MALITCPDCEKQISDAAPACPHCGRPMTPAAAAPPPPPEPAPRVVKVVETRNQEGCFLQTLNAGCLTIVALIVVAFVIGTCSGR